jgi:hypothetical protein
MYIPVSTKAILPSRLAVAIKRGFLGEKARADILRVCTDCFLMMIMMMFTLINYNERCYKINSLHG